MEIEIALSHAPRRSFNKRPSAALPPRIIMPCIVHVFDVIINKLNLPRHSVTLRFRNISRRKCILPFHGESFWYMCSLFSCHLTLGTERIRIVHMHTSHMLRQSSSDESTFFTLTCVCVCFSALSVCHVAMRCIVCTKCNGEHSIFELV